MPRFTELDSGMLIRSDHIVSLRKRDGVGGPVYVLDYEMGHNSCNINLTRVEYERIRAELIAELNPPKPAPTGGRPDPQSIID